MRASSLPPREREIHARRLAALILTALLTSVGVLLFVDVVAADGFGPLDLLRVLLLALSSGWLAWGACTAFIGLAFPPEAQKPDPDWTGPRGRVAILMPICNESATAVFARILAIHQELKASGHGDAFDFHILSDSNRPDRAAEERRLHRAMIAAFGAGNRIFYRRRTDNSGRKAGNIKSFVTASGGAYETMLVLDADSVMSAGTIIEMVRRMDQDPELGLLQTLPLVIGRSSLFGRVLQFSAAVYAPVFSRGVAALQGRHGPFWGHNALIRVKAFAGSCGLPVLPGAPPFGGDVLSHDFVEAALLARAGWKVRLDPDLGGSYEEAPANLLEYAKRDRRWCQGNLQHAMVLGTPGFPYWSRVSLLQGILAYLASPMWALFLIAGLVAVAAAPTPVYFPIEGSAVPIFPQSERGKAIALIVGIAALLVLPKALIVMRALVHESLNGYRGAWALVAGGFGELLLSSVLAPIIMMFQTRAVAEVLLGRDGGWPAADRDDGSVGLRAAFGASWWMTATGAAALAVGWIFAPELLMWLWPVALPLVLAPVVISATASTGAGRAAAALFSTPAETAPESVIRRARALRHVIGTAEEPATDDTDTSLDKVLSDAAIGRAPGVGG